MSMRRGFTLVELLVVMAIIALLMAVLLPTLGGVRTQARTAVCLSNMRALSLALQTYLHCNQDRFPSYGYKHGAASDPHKSWVHVMADEYGRTGGDIHGQGSSATLRGEVRDVRRCPADGSLHFVQPRQVGTSAERVWRQTSYGSNFYLAADDALQIFKEERFERLGRIPRPATTIYWVELAETGEFATADHIHAEKWIYAPGADWRAKAATEIALARHSGRANYGFVDGHARTQRFEDTYAIDLAGSRPPDIAWFHNMYDPDVGR